MDIHPAGTRPTTRANPEYFTGTVWMDPVIGSHPPARLNALVVSFEPGARTAWHTHPLGQTLYVMSGTGRVCLRGEKPKVIRAGDTIWIPPGEEHWHGAGPDTGMVHMAMQEAQEGSAADWLEHVTNADYAQSPEVG